ncbi:MAG: sodium:solute symporter family protein [Peptococcaceae bacterium]
MNIPLIIVLVYIVVLYLISWYSTKLSKNGGIIGYLLAGRGLPAGVVAAMLAGLAVGGASTIGVAETAYSAGISAGWYNAAWAAGALAVGLVAAAKYRALEVTTIPELFERYFDTSGRIIAVIGQIIIQIVISSLQYVAGGAILAALLPNIFTFNTGMLTSAIVFIGITLIGGYWAAGLSNLINVTVIYIGIIIGVFLCMGDVGGFANLTTMLPPGDQWFSPFMGVGMAVVIANFMVMITQCFSTQAVVQISFAAKDTKTAKKGFLLGALIIFPIGFLSAVLGIIAAAKFPGITPALALPQTIISLNPWAAGFVLAGLWAADVSTAVALLLGSSTLIVEDIWKRFIQPDIPQKQQLLLSRSVVLIISLLTYFLATSVLGIIKTLLIGLTLTTSYTAVLLFLLFAPQYCRRGSAFWTVLTGMIFLALWQFVPAIRIVPHPIFLAWPVALVTFLVVYLIDSRPIKSMKQGNPVSM